MVPIQIQSQTQCVTDRRARGFSPTGFRCAALASVTGFYRKQTVGSGPLVMWLRSAPLRSARLRVHHSLSHIESKRKARSALIQRHWPLWRPTCPQARSALNPQNVKRCSKWFRLYSKLGGFFVPGARRIGGFLQFAAVKNSTCY